MEHTREQVNQFAEYLSEGKSPEESVRLLGLSNAHAIRLLNHVRFDLGSQAR